LCKEKRKREKIDYINNYKGLKLAPKEINKNIALFI